jgi:hypothetical protein
VKVELLSPDVAAAQATPTADASAFAHALEQVGSQLSSATAAEDAYANGGGSLQSAMYERARADVALSVATATAARLSQAISSVLNLQI